MTSFSRHLRETAWIAAPIALAQVAQMGMALTDTVMLGGVGPDALAAGSLGANIFVTVLFVLQGVLSGVGVLVARARGAGEHALVPPIYWSGVLLAIALSAPLFWAAGALEPLLRRAGEAPSLAADVSAYLRVLRWGAPAGVIGIGLMRVFLPATGLERVLLWVIPSAVGLNLALNQVFIHGVVLGSVVVPGFGLRGSAAATAVSLWVVALAMLALLHGRVSWRHLTVPSLPRMSVMGSLLSIGLPVGAAVFVEVTMFLGAGLLAATMGSIVLAAHMMVLSVASTSFVVAFAISQAANVRVATAIGAGMPLAARRAGMAALVLAAAFMATTAIAMLVLPHTILGVYVDARTAGGAATVAVGVGLLRIAAMFQVVDGVQTTAAGALRGLRDTRVPMLLATFGYWVIGLPAAWVFAIWLGAGAEGLWWGLFLGLATAAACMSARFQARTRRLRA